MYIKQYIFTFGLLFITIIVYAGIINSKNVFAGADESELSVTLEGKTQFNSPFATTNDVITYTLSYDNTGDLEATEPFLLGTIPDGACYILNTLQKSDTNITNILYSNDDGATFSYTPTPDERNTDCSVTTIKVTFNSELPTPASHILLASYNDLFVGAAVSNNVSFFDVMNTNATIQLLNLGHYESRTANMANGTRTHVRMVDIIGNSTPELIMGTTDYYGISYPGHASFQVMPDRSAIYNVIGYNSMGAGRSFVAVGYFNNDAVRDIVSVSNRVGCAMSTLTNTWNQTSTCLVQDDDIYKTSINVGKFNNDAFADLLVGSEAMLSRIHFGNGDGTFTQGPLVGMASMDTVVADFNRDGYDDFISVNSTSRSKGLYINNGNGTFTKATGENAFELSSGIVGSIKLADINEDTHLDVLFTYGPQTELWINDTTGRFNKATGIADLNNYPNKYTADMLDVDGDSHLDLVFSQSYLEIKVLWGAGAAGFSDVSTIFTGISGTPLEYDTGDFNGDGQKDLVVRVGATVYVLRGQGSRTFVRETLIYGAADQYNSINIYDFDSDGFDDISYQYGNTIAVFWGRVLGYVPAGQYKKVLTAPNDITQWKYLTFTTEIPSVAGVTYSVNHNDCTTPYSGFESITPPQGFVSVDLSSIDVSEKAVCIGFDFTSTSREHTATVSDIKISYTTPEQPWIKFSVKTNDTVLPSAITNQANIGSTTLDSNTNNNTSVSSITAPQVNLFTDLSAITTHALGGDSVELDITFGNLLESNTTGLSFTITLPPEAETVTQIEPANSSAGNLFTCATIDHTVKCNRSIEVTNGIILDELYAMVPAGWGDSNLYQINRNDGSTIATREITATWTGASVEGGLGLRRDPSSDVVYALIKTSDVARKDPPVLATLNLETGQATFICQTTQRFADFTIDSNGVFYATTGPGGGNGTMPNKLFTLDKTTCQATEILSLPARDSGSTIEYNPDNGYLYHISGYDRMMDVIDPNTFTILTTTEIEPNPQDWPASALTYLGNGEFLMDSWADTYLLRTDGSAEYLYTLDGPDAAKAFIFAKGERFNETGELTNLETTRMRLSVQLIPTIPHGTVLNFTSAISNKYSEQDTNNNSSDTTVHIGNYSDILFSSATPYNSSSNSARLEFTIENVGSEHSTDTTITIELPTGFIYNAAASSLKQCSTPQQSTLICSIGDIGPNTSSSYVMFFDQSTALVGTHTIDLLLENTATERRTDNNKIRISYQKTLSLLPIYRQPPQVFDFSSPLQKRTIQNITLQQLEEFIKTRTVVLSIMPEDTITSITATDTVTLTVLDITESHISLATNNGEQYILPIGGTKIVYTSTQGELTVTLLSVSETTASLTFQEVLGNTTTPTPSQTVIPTDQARAPQPYSQLYIGIALFLGVVAYIIIRNKKNSK